MKIFKNISRTKQLAIVVLIIGIFIGLGARSLIAAYAETSWGLLYQVLGIVKTQFVEKDVQDQKLIYGAAKGLLKSLDDPYTRFVEPKAFDEMKIRLSGNFAGVGIQIGMKDDFLTVIAPIDDTPAFKAGIKTSDKIIAIDGKDTDDMSLEEAVSLIRGPKGTKVSLTILRGIKNEKKEFTLVRDNIKLNALRTKKIIDKKYGIGYIHLITFESKDALDEVIAVLKKLDQEGMKGLILDLRNNGGGLLDNAIEMGSIFIKEGPIVHTIDRNKNKETFEVVETDYTWYDKPLLVLINGGSASASEILAGAIEDSGRGRLIGTRSFGKASVQNIKPFSDGSAMLITVAKYLTPKGADINKVGITPNVIVEIPTEDIKAAMEPDYEYSEDKDLQVQTAIKEMQKELQKNSK
jgi:carboxyl-terminal processing protease